MTRANEILHQDTEALMSLDLASLRVVSEWLKDWRAGDVKWRGVVVKEAIRRKEETDEPEEADI